MASGYQVIARRWRPRQFDELVGQDHIVRTLKNAIDQERIAHAYLFVGPRGTGKTSCARILAKCLNCENGPLVSPPNDSPLCEAIMRGNCMDVIEIDGASNNSVDQVRELREDCQYAPAQCRYKIYIIDEVHMLTTQAFNALLKTLEEPPPHVKFIFATTESQKVLPTIVSRCQRFEFRPIPDRVIADRLLEIAKSEEIQVETNAIDSIAHMANGGMRDAQSILDQLISFCGDAITEKEVIDVYGLASRERIEAMAKAMAEGDYGALLALVEKLAGEGRDLYRVLVDLQVYVREALLDAVKRGGNSGRLGESLSAEALMRMLDTLQAGESQVKMGLSERVNFEVTLLKAVEASRTRAIDSLIRELSDLAKGLPKAEVGERRGEVAEDKIDHRRPSVGATEPLETVSHGSAKGQDRRGLQKEILTEAEGGSPDERMSEELRPRLEKLAAQLPESTRKVLKEELRGQFRGVRRYKPEELV